MTTTCMRDSIVGDAWIKQAVALNPIQHMGESTFLTCPVRLSFPKLFVAESYRRKDGTMTPPSFGVGVMFPPFCDLSGMEAGIVRLGATRWPKCFSGDQLFGVKSPFRDQGEKANKEGYTPGLKFFNANSVKNERRSRIPVYDRPPEMLPVNDPGKVYGGIWALVSITFYCSSGEQVIAAGLNGVTLFGDDKRLGGSGGPSEDQIKGHFAGVRAGAPIAVPGMGGHTPPAAAAPLSDADLLRQMMGN